MEVVPEIISISDTWNQNKSEENDIKLKDAETKALQAALSADIEAVRFIS